MKAFTEAFTAIDGTNATNNKIAFLAAYFANADDLSIAHALYFLTGRRLKRAVSSRKMWGWLAESQELPLWLIEECYSVVGDSAETVALLVADEKITTAACDRSLAEIVTTIVKPLAGMTEGEQRQLLETTWAGLSRSEIFLLNKFITGGFRIGMAKKLVTRALAQAFGQDESRLTHQLMGPWPVSAEFIAGLREIDRSQTQNLAQPYPFCLAYPLEGGPESLGDPKNWVAEWKLDGIRCQLIRRQGETFLWSRGEDLINDSFPDLLAAGSELPDGTVIDGELLVWQAGRSQPEAFHRLQKRLGRKKPSAKLQAELPVALKVYDLLEWNGEDIRAKAFVERRNSLEKMFAKISTPALHLSEALAFTEWHDLRKFWQNSRDHLAEGLMIKHRQSPFHQGRKKGDWWKWKVEPMTLDAVMIYAEAGTGRRASLYTSYTFAIWNEEGSLVPIAKAYSGLTDEEIKVLDRWIKRNTQEKFGPVRKVPAEKVFEIGFEGIAPSTRHKAGIALRFPRILRVRDDKPAAEADTTTTAKALLAAFEPAHG